MDKQINISKLLNLKLPLVLASQSPRRKKLLEQLGFEFRIVPAELDEENHSQGLKPEEYAKHLAFAKAKAIAEKMNEPAIVIGSDTIVVLDDIILNKPNGREDAVDMLKTLSGRTHTVFTGVALVESVTMRNTADVKSTKVTFRELEQQEIETYVDTGSPLDKAGAYGIQDDFGAVFVTHIEGCYYNIVGLPLEMLYSELKTFIKNK